MSEVRVQIVNQKGLHARASAKFVELAETFDARVTVEKDGMEALGDSIMGLLMLAASKGTYVNIRASGDAAEDALTALTSLVENRFGEDN